MWINLDKNGRIPHKIPQICTNSHYFPSITPGIFPSCFPSSQIFLKIWAMAKKSQKKRREKRAEKPWGSFPIIPILNYSQNSSQGGEIPPQIPGKFKLKIPKKKGIWGFIIPEGFLEMLFPWIGWEKKCE